MDDEHTKSPKSPSVPIAFPQVQKPIFSVLSKGFYPVSLRMHNKSTQKKLASHKKTSQCKVSRRSLVTIAKKNNLEAKKKRCVVRKRIATISISSHYTYLPKYKAEQPPEYQIDSLKRDINVKLFGKADTLIDKILSCSASSFQIRKQ